MLLKNSIVSVVTSNYLRPAVALHESILRYNPSAECYVFILDTEEQTNQQITISPLDKTPRNKINLLGSCFLTERVKRSAEYFSAFELSCAAKTCAMRFAMNELDSDVTIYLDSDFYCYNSLDSIFSAISGNSQASIFLTPHCLHPPADISGDIGSFEFLRVGYFNAGFLAAKRSPEIFKVLDWLEEKVTRFGFCEPRASMFVDQAWISMLPNVYPQDVHAISHPGVNIGHWNLFERQLSTANQEYLVNDEQLLLFHFSGFDPGLPNQLSRYPRRQADPKTESIANTLCMGYAESLAKHQNYETLIKRSPLPEKTLNERVLSWKNRFGESQATLLVESIIRLEDAFQQSQQKQQHNRPSWLSRIASRLTRLQC